VHKSICATEPQALYPPEQGADQPAVPMRPYDAAEPQAAPDLQSRSQPHNPAHNPHAQLIGLNLRKLYIPGFHQVLVHPPALRSGFSLPARDRPLV
jgi:hypothetical protein